ncbi:XdhC family protein [Microbacterium sp. Au-Mic1]|uniref:XdhC family protein n=1 Tax=Microbacterium sp. Au-Mic1 TaxID=2906457 RepID=UPI001E2E4425|nr:XdhC/CoxI family protein [Microbacterium sp. Au-Mic1]MCE4027468.1 XdhC family protein [Microbacterium sp. Au-Mic1]
MLDRVDEYGECFAEPDRWAIATIVEVSGSVPRPAGTSMAVRDDGRTIGSVSGGCIEGAVVDAALTCLDSGATELHSFGYADDDGISIGLMCGGDVRVLVQPVRALGTVDPGARAHLVRDLPLHDTTAGALLTAEGLGIALGADAVCAAFDGEQLPAEVARAAGRSADHVRAALRAGGTHVIDVTDRTATECPVVRRLLVESTATPARLLIYGANDFSAALAQAAAALGRHVTVCDARPVFATRDRHPGAHEVVLMHPAEHFAQEVAAGRVDGRTAIVMLTHDPRFDLPVLDAALRREVSYVGAMGSRVTHEKREQELRAGGLTSAHLDRLHSPIGLDLGARTPAEVAVSILAELILVESAARAGSGSAAASSPAEAGNRALPARLRDTAGDVHDDARRGAEPVATTVTAERGSGAASAGRTCAAAPRLSATPKEALAWT